MPLTTISEDDAAELYEALFDAVETAMDTRGESFYRLSLASGVDQSVLSRARQRAFKLSADNLLSVLLAVFGSETQEYAKALKVAAKKKA